MIVMLVNCNTKEKSYFLTKQTLVTQYDMKLESLPLNTEYINKSLSYIVMQTYKASF